MLHHALTQILLLLLIALFAGMGARRLQLPFTLALVLTGVALGFLHIEELAGLHLTPDLLLLLFLPPLLFEASYHLDWTRFKRDAPAILTLAIPGVLVAVTVTAFVSYGLLSAVGVREFSLGMAFLLASVISATDPISVLALFKVLGVEKRLYLLVEGESLLNDGIAVVVFIIVAGVLGVPTGYEAPESLHTVSEIAVYGVKTFFWMAGAGTIIGVMAGTAASVLTSKVDDRLIEIGITVVLAYGSFLLAEEAHASGVLSCVAAGMVHGSYGSRIGMSATTRVAVADFWEFLSFFSNTFIFLLIGLELDIPELLAWSGPVALVFLAVLLGRAVVVYGSLPLLRWLKVERVPRSWGHILFWGGLRGSLSMVLVIGLPPSLPERRVLLLLVFGLVSVSLLLQGLTMKPLLQRLKLISDPSEKIPYERARARALMAASALRELDRQRRQGAVPPRIADQLQGQYQSYKDEAEEAATRLAGDALAAEQLQETALHLLTIEEETLRHAAAEGVVASAAAEELLLDLASRREALKHGH